MPVQPKDLIDDVLSRGRYAFTVDEAAEILALDRDATVDAMRRLRGRHAVFSPARGLYFAVPPEYRSWRVVPGEWFVDAMMTHLAKPYYVALLSAAAIHGSAHQSPQVFQVMTLDASNLRDRQIARVRVRFHGSKFVSEDPTKQITVPTGYVTVSTKETTAVDLITHTRVAGGLGNVATILREIGVLHGSTLARVASRRSRAVARRTGWLVENFGQTDDLEALRQAARLDLGEPPLLDPSGRKRGRTDRDWRVRVNAAVETDV